MFEPPIGTRSPGQQLPVGSVVTFLDRHRRTVFGTVTELRRHDAIVAAGETPDGACATPDSGSSRPAPRAERRCSRSRPPSASCCQRPGAPHPGHAPARYRTRGRRAPPRTRRLVTDPPATATGPTTVRGPAPPPRAGGSFGPPSRPVDDTPSGSFAALARKLQPHRDCRREFDSHYLQYP